LTYICLLSRRYNFEIVSHTEKNHVSKNRRDASNRSSSIVKIVRTVYDIP